MAQRSSDVATRCCVPALVTRDRIVTSTYSDLTPSNIAVTYHQQETVSPTPTDDGKGFFFQLLR